MVVRAQGNYGGDPFVMVMSREGTHKGVRREGGLRRQAGGGRVIKQG